MGNHHIDCDYCHKDTRGLSGVKGCYSREDADKCWQFKQLQAERLRREQYEDAKAEHYELERQSTGRF